MSCDSIHGKCPEQADPQRAGGAQALGRQGGDSVPFWGDRSVSEVGSGVAPHYECTQNH